MHENDDPWLATRGIDPFDQLDNYMEETVSRISSFVIRDRAKCSCALRRERRCSVKGTAMYGLCQLRDGGEKRNGEGEGEVAVFSAKRWDRRNNLALIESAAPCLFVFNLF